MPPWFINIYYAVFYRKIFWHEQETVQGRVGSLQKVSGPHGESFRIS